MWCKKEVCWETISRYGKPSVLVTSTWRMRQDCPESVSRLPIDGAMQEAREGVIEVLQSSLLPSESGRWIESRCHNEGVALFNLHRFKQVTFNTALRGNGGSGYGKQRCWPCLLHALHKETGKKQAPPTSHSSHGCSRVGRMRMPGGRVRFDGCQVINF